LVKALARKILARAHLLELAGHTSRRLRGVSRSLRGVDRSLSSRYLNEAVELRLQLGCGSNILDGWLNSDYYPVIPGVMHLDATNRYPFADATFAYAFSEHMIEHIPYEGAEVMLRECHRILKPGGKVRITTPDLAFVIALYGDALSDLQKAYTAWGAKELPGDSPGFVINNFVRNWGHLFIYDEQTLGDVMRAAGFARVTRCELNESETPVFRGLENEKRMPDGFLKLESLTLEASK
jgi:predicted SAM-dependent methyltransferase